MALNFSHRPVFPARLSEDNLVSPMRIASGYLVEGISEKSGDGYSKPWPSSAEIDECFGYGREKADRCGSQDSVSNDIIDLLPSDPFGMDISTTFTAISGWLEDLEVDYGRHGGNEVGRGDSNCQLFAGLNFIWNNAMRFQAFPGNMGFDHKCDIMTGFGGYYVEKEIRDGSCPHSLRSDCDMGNLLNSGEGNMSTSGQHSEGYSSHDVIESACTVNGIWSFRNEEMAVAGLQTEKIQEGSGIGLEGNGGAPHSALSFALGYLGVRDLLVVEKVCSSLRSNIQTDPLLWRSIHVDQPLNEKITDDALLQLTNRAQGNLQYLSLVECPRITDDGLKRVLETNLKLTKLSVPGCTRLSIEGIVNSLRTFKSKGARGVKFLRIGGLYGVTQKHFEELKFLLGTDDQPQQNTHKPHFYHRGNFYRSLDDDRAIDVEICPKCQNLRLVYDCPAESCQGKEHATQECRACTLCIARCIQCGRCINDSEYEETFCLELLCSDCWKQVLTCQESQDAKITSSKSPVHHGLSGEVCLRG